MNRKTRHVARTSAVGVAMLALGEALNQPASGQTRTRDARTAQAFGLTRFETQLIPAIDADAPALRLAVTVDGQPLHLLLERHSMRAADFRVFEADAKGVLREVAAPPPRTFRGMVEGFEGSRVAASILGGQFHATVMFDDEALWSIQPVADALPKENPRLHVVYRHDDVLEHEFTCGVPADEPQREPGRPIMPAEDEGGLAGATLYDTQIAFDADYEFYLLNGSSVANTIADIENVMVSVETIYINQVQISYSITAIIVRTAEPDPYSSTNHDALLCQFRNHWNASQGGIARDVAHLMTGKEIDGNIIGVAWLGVVCNNTVYSNCGANGVLSYGLSQSRFSTNLAQRASLTAHELGHNWNAVHCNGDLDCGIMCSTLGGCTGSHTTFGATPAADIIAWRNQANCLTPSDAVPGPFQLLAPSNAAGSVGSGPIFSWSASQFANDYTLTVDDNADFSSPAINLTTASLNYDAPPGTLLPQTYYFWRVRANNGNGSTTALPAQRVLLTTVAMPQTLYIDGSSMNPGVGGTWSEARTDLQYMVSVAAASNGAISEVRIADGAYRPAGPGGDRTASFLLANGVTIKGGYAGVGAPDPDARNITLFPTILSGDLNANDGPSGSFLNYGDNSYHVVRGDGVNSTAVLDGVTIRAGNANGTCPACSGGGIVMQSGSEAGSPTIIDCLFVHNMALNGGAAYGGDGAPVFQGCSFVGNLATTYSGGAYGHGGSGSTTFTDCAFIDNSAQASDGGAIHWGSVTGELSAENCDFLGNSAWRGGAVSIGANSGPVQIHNCSFTNNSAWGNDGGAMLCRGSSATITNSAFTNNSTTSPDADGGAIQFDSGILEIQNSQFSLNESRQGGAISIGSPAGPSTVSNCQFTSNDAALDGGAIVKGASTGVLTLSDCQFDANHAGVRGGAIRLSSAGNFTACQFIGNQSDDDGGALYGQQASGSMRECAFSGNIAVFDGGAMHLQGCVLTIVRADFVNNSAGFGGAIKHTAGCDMDYASCRFLGNVASSNAGAMEVVGSSVVMQISLLSGNTANAGGGVVVSDDSTGVFQSCTFSANEATLASGGIQADHSGTHLHLRNCAVWGNVANGATDQNAQVSVGGGATSDVMACAIQGWNASLGGAMNSGVNPLFKDADGPDDTPGTLDDDVRPTRRSLCIDMSDGYLAADSFDLDDDADTSEPLPLDIYGNSRMVECLDIGAAEYDGVDPTMLDVGCDGSSKRACFSGMGDLPGGLVRSRAWGLSADGMVVTGGSDSAASTSSNDEGFKWTVSGMVGLGDLAGDILVSHGFGVSGDGRLIVGQGRAPNNGEACLWSPCMGMVQIGPADPAASEARAASANGAFIAGSLLGASVNAFRWSQATGAVSIGDLPGGPDYSIAYGISADGAIVVGSSISQFGYEAFRWTDGGMMEPLGDLVGGIFDSGARAVSPDGGVVVGYGVNSDGLEAVRWVGSASPEPLGELLGGTYASLAQDVSANGQVIVGYSETDPGQTAFVWTEPAGMQDLRDFLIVEFGLGAELTGWHLLNATGISDDGQTICGYGANPTGQLEGWIAHIPYLPLPPCPADIAPSGGNGIVNVQDLLAVIAAWGACANPNNCPADIAPPGGNDVVNVQDLLAVIGAWGACP